MNIELMEHLELNAKERKIDVTMSLDKLIEDLECARDRLSFTTLPNLELYILQCLYTMAKELKKVQEIPQRMDEMEYRERFNEK